MTEPAKQDNTEPAPDINELQSAVYTASEAYAEDPNDDNKTAMQEAIKVAKEASTAASEKAVADAKAAEEAAEKNKPPETYDIKAPKESPLSAEHISSVAKYAKEKGMSNEQAQSLLERDHSIVVAVKESQLKEFETTKSGWADQAKADKEIGGDKLEKNIELAKRVTSRYATPEFQEVLVKTGFGNHPELVRMLKRIGESMSEDQLEVQNNSGAGERDPADVLYGSKS